MADTVIVISDPGPEWLYKYRSIDGPNLEYLRRTLLEQEIFFAAPRSLNDPFDCRITFEYKERSDGDIRAIFDRELRLMEPELSRTERRQRVRERMRSGWFRQQDFWTKLTAEMQSDIDGRGVLCLTEVPDDPLMWAHYGSGHRGICLKFRHAGNRFFGRAQRVRYSDEPRTIDPFDGSLVGLQIASLLVTKTTAWAYEKEWRIVDHRVGPGVQVFSPYLLCAVILGMRTEESDREQICQWTRMRSHPTELLQAEEHRGAVVLKRV
jgi:hypothetical protein